MYHTFFCLSTPEMKKARIFIRALYSGAVYFFSNRRTFQEAFFRTAFTVPFSVFVF